MKMILALIIASVISAGIGYFVGKYNGVDLEDIEQMEQATEGLQEFTAKLNEMNAENERCLKEKYSVCLPVLTAIENQEYNKAKEILIDEFGAFYYNYTYEDERHMNPDIIEQYLKELEEKAVTDPSFQQIINFKPEN